jgi:hypothetical protein
VTFDVTTVMILGRHEPRPYKTVNLSINIVCVLTTQPTAHSPVSVPLHMPPYSLRHNYIEIRPINNLTMVSKYSSERKMVSILAINYF